MSCKLRRVTILSIYPFYTKDIYASANKMRFSFPWLPRRSACPFKFIFSTHSGFIRTSLPMLIYMSHCPSSSTHFILIPLSFKRSLVSLSKAFNRDIQIVAPYSYKIGPYTVAVFQNPVRRSRATSLFRISTASITRSCNCSRNSESLLFKASRRASRAEYPLPPKSRRSYFSSFVLCFSASTLRVLYSESPSIFADSMHSTQI